MPASRRQHSKGPTGRLRLAIGLMALVLGYMAIAKDAEAINRRGHYIWATTTSGASLVGNLNERLSQACRAREFNQRRPYHIVIRFKGDRDTGVSGIATTNWNLYDPLGLAAPLMTFHFFNDGYSNCRVYVSPQR